MESEVSLLQQLSAKNRHLYQQRIIAETEIEKQACTFTGIYEPSSGLTQLFDSNGSSFYGTAITNGSVGKGDAIRLRRGGGAIGATYDSLPRCTPKSTTTKKIKTVNVITSITLIGSYEIYANSIFIKSVNFSIAINSLLNGATNLNEDYKRLFIRGDTSRVAFPDYSKLSNIELKKVIGVSGYQANNCASTAIGVFADLTILTTDGIYNVFSFVVLGCPSEVPFNAYGSFNIVTQNLTIIKTTKNE